MNPESQVSLFANAWVVPGLILAGGVVVGWVADRVARVQLLRWATSTPWKGDEILLKAIRGVTWLWFSLFAVHLAARLAPLHPDVAAFISRAIEILVIISLTVVTARIATGVMELHAERITFKGSATVIPLLIKICLFIIGGLVILQTEGISIAPILTALGVGGLAVALALQDTLGNLFAGLNTLMAGQIRPGDFIKLDADHEGWVLDIGWRNTSIRTLANNLVVVPNKRLAESIVTNFSKPEPELSVNVPIGVAYESDLEHVEQVLMQLGTEIAAAHEGVLTEKPPTVRFIAFADSSIETRLFLRVRDIETFYLVRHLLVKSIHSRLRQAGISIAYPTRTMIVQSAAPGPLTGPLASPSVAVPPRGIESQADEH